MAETTTYYLGRVIKMGQLNTDMIVSAVLRPKPVVWWGNGWSFFDAARHETRGIEYVCARLSKFNPEGEVVIADPRTRQEVIQSEPNLRVASSSFIYIPTIAGVAFTKVYNHIEERHFVRRFCQIIEETHENFFVQCDIRLISDLRTFAEKLRALDGITRIAATLNPPNPIFGPLWKSLKEYIASRRAERMLVREESGRNAFLNTQLPNHVERVATQTISTPYEPAEPIPIGDAAILMAADGYGSGIVRGVLRSEKVVIKTSETVKNFEFEREPTPEGLFEATYNIFRRIEEERHMEH